MVDAQVSCSSPRTFIERGAPVFFCGIGGVGMAGLARLLLQQGLSVSGSERVPNRLTDALAAEGARVDAGHDQGLPADVEWVVRTPAVSEDNPLLRQAEQRHLPVFTRGALLAAVANARRGIAVAGAHGKTTTSAMTAWILRQCGVSAGYAVGGECGLPGSLADLGQEDVFVFEADESDGSLVGYRPALAVVTNLEWDHVDHFASEEALHGCFQRFMRQAERLVLCADDPGLLALSSAHAAVQTAGFAATADVRIDVLEEHPGGMHCRVRSGGRDCGSVLLPMTGRHNAGNAAMAILACEAFGVAPEEAMRALERFELPARRFDLQRRGKRILIGDYAHHPTEIEALLNALVPLGASRVLAVFQPHRYSRTLHLRDRFAEVLRGLPSLQLVPTYAASEDEIPGGRSEDLAEAIGLPPERVHGTLEAAWDCLQRDWTEDCALLVIGAGDVVKIYDWALAWLKEMETNE